MRTSNFLINIPENLQDFLKLDEVGNQQLIDDYLSGDVWSFNRLNQFIEDASYISAFRFRDQYTARIGFVLYAIEMLDALAILLKNKKVIEAGAGTGFLSKQLKNRNIQIEPVDIGDWYENNGFTEPYFCHIHKENAVHYIENNWHDAVVMSWPNIGSPFAYTVAKAMGKDSILVFQGEGKYGCTGDDQFFEYLDNEFQICDEETKLLNKYHVQFYGLHDRWMVFRKTS